MMLGLLVFVVRGNGNRQGEEYREAEVEFEKEKLEQEVQAEIKVANDKIEARVSCRDDRYL